MKEKTLRVTKNTLSFLVVGLYIACCMDTLIHIRPYESAPASFLSMILSVLFFLSLIPFLRFFRKSRGVLCASLIMTVLSALYVICNYALSIPILALLTTILAFWIFIPLYELWRIPFVQQDEKFVLLTMIIFILLFIYALVLLILLKKDFYNKRRRQTNETT